MDPYLEDDRLWPAFQHRLVTTIHQALVPGLVGRYRADIIERRYRPGDDETGSDAHGEQVEQSIEVRDRAEGKLVTLIDVVSPANKTTAAGRTAYLTQRRAAQTAGATVVEIDLVLQGDPTLDYDRSGLPDWDYAVTVVRSTQPERYEIYTSTLQKRLPKFRLPLTPDDRDQVLVLQAAFTRCYDEGGFARRIDYRSEPPVPLSEGVRGRLDEVLNRGAGPPAGDYPPHEEIARTAFQLWQDDGCPHGRDQEHWYRAVDMLRRPPGPE
jgi:hypothetical protein